MKRVLVTDYVHPLLIDGLQERGFYVDYDTSVTMKELPQMIGEYTGIVINSKIRMFQPIIDRADKLEFIARLGSGMEIVDVAYANVKGIHAFNTPKGNCNAVGEHALGMLLALFNNLLKSDREVRAKVWDRESNRGKEITGKTVGIIGFGHTGKAFAEKLKSWDVELIAYDKYVPDFGPEYDYVASVSQEEVQQRADIISLHLPLTEDTKYLVDAAFLGGCIDGCTLINTSRGHVVVLKDLLDALDLGKLYGACLDVYENEKPHTFTEEEEKIYDQLYGRNDVVLSPHVAGWTFESLEKIARNVLYEIDLKIK